MAAAREELGLGFDSLAADATCYSKQKKIGEYHAALKYIDAELADFDAKVERTRDEHEQLKLAFADAAVARVLDQQLEALIANGATVLRDARAAHLRAIARLEDELVDLDRRADARRAAVIQGPVLDPRVVELLPPAVLDRLPRRRLARVHSGARALVVRTRRCPILRVRGRSRASRRRLGVRTAATRATADPDGDGDGDGEPPPGPSAPATAGGVSW